MTQHDIGELPEVSLEDIKPLSLEVSPEEALEAYKSETRNLEHAHRDGLIERFRLDTERLQAEVDTLKIEVKSREQDMAARQLYANRIFWLIATWLLVVFFFLVGDGFSLGGFDLTDAVLISLIGGTTANVIGIFLIVVSYLFPKSK